MTKKQLSELNELIAESEELRGRLIDFWDDLEESRREIIRKQMSYHDSVDEEQLLSFQIDYLDEAIKASDDVYYQLILAKRTQFQT